MEVILRKLEEDAKEILKFMASNGLVANPTKTSFMVLNNRGEEEKVKIRVGNCTIENESTAKLLGVMVDEDQKWTSHCQGVVKALNQRTGLIRRMKNHLSGEKVKKLVDSIWTSKLRYGLQLCGKVRISEEMGRNKQLTQLQMAQNRMLRMLANKRIRDKVSIKSMLDKQKWLSVNQTNAQIKLTEMWKMQNDEKYPLKGKRQATTMEGRETRGNAKGKWIEPGKSEIVQSSFMGDAIRLWNRAPRNIENAKTMCGAKKEIKKYCLTLPI